MSSRRGSRSRKIGTRRSGGVASRGSSGVGGGQQKGIWHDWMNRYTTWYRGHGKPIIDTVGLVGGLTGLGASLYALYKSHRRRDDDYDRRRYLVGSQYGFTPMVPRSLSDWYYYPTLPDTYSFSSYPDYESLPKHGILYGTEARALARRLGTYQIPKTASEYYKKLRKLAKFAENLPCRLIHYELY